MIEEDIGRFLEYGGFGTFGVDITSNVMRDNPVDCITVQSVEGMAPSYVLSVGTDIYYHAIVVYVRSASNKTGQTKINMIDSYLNKKYDININGMYYDLVVRLGSQPILAERTDTGAYIWKSTYRVSQTQEN